MLRSTRPEKISCPRDASSTNENARHDRPGGSKKTFGYVQRSDLTRDDLVICALLDIRRSSSGRRWRRSRTGAPRAFVLVISANLVGGSAHAAAEGVC